MYNYNEQKKEIFTEEGFEKFFKIKSRVQALLTIAGACTMSKAIQGVLGNNWLNMACVDRLVELGEIKELHMGNPWVKYKGDRVFILNK